jgi:hypothetical protein
VNLSARDAEVRLGDQKPVGQDVKGERRTLNMELKLEQPVMISRSGGMEHAARTE